MSEHVLSEATLTGDIRDMILTHIRAMETPWSKLSQREQETKIEAAKKAAETLVRNAVTLISTKGFTRILVETGKWTVDKGIKLETVASAIEENISALAAHGKGPAILVLAETSAFFGERQAAKADPDQPDMLDEDAASDDEIYAKAREFILAEGKCSVQLLQIEYKIGYNRAAALVERLEQEGLVSPADHNGRRDVIAPTETEEAPTANGEAEPADETTADSETVEPTLDTLAEGEAAPAEEVASDPAPETRDWGPSFDEIEPTAESPAPASDVNTVPVTKNGKRTRVSLAELKEAQAAGKVKVHDIGDVEMV